MEKDDDSTNYMTARISFLDKHERTQPGPLEKYQWRDAAKHWLRNKRSVQEREGRSSMPSLRDYDSESLAQARYMYTECPAELHRPLVAFDVFIQR